MNFEIGLQIVVAILLCVTIAYAVLLNRRLSRLRDGNAAMQAIAGELGSAAAQAERGIATLRKTAFEDDEALGRRIAEARAMRDDIGFLVDRAESLATRLETLIGDSRDLAAAAPSAAAQPPATAARPAPVEDEHDLFADDAAADGADVEAARAARATATAWLRSRAMREPATAVASRGLR